MSDKDKYVEKAKAKMAQWNAEIEKLQAKADEAGADAKIEYKRQIEELREQRDEAQAKLREIAGASDDAWTDMKSGLDKAWDSMSDAFDRAMARFK